MEMCSQQTMGDIPFPKLEASRGKLQEDFLFLIYIKQCLASG